MMSSNIGVSQIEFAVEKELPSSRPGYQVLIQHFSATINSDGLIDGERYNQFLS